MQFAVTLALVGLAWLASALTCVGLGLAVWRVIGVRRIDSEHLLLAFWLGLGIALWLLQLWHLVLPVTGLASLLLLALGGAALFHCRSGLIAGLRDWRSGPIGVVLLGLAAVWLADQSLRGLEHFDTGLYLQGAMRWATEHPIVPGLGNLHLRFAFNNAHLLYAALFDVGPFAGSVPHLVNGALGIVLLAQCLECAARALGSDRASGLAGEAFGAAMLVPAVLLSRSYLVSLSTDVPATLLAMVVAWRGFRLLAGEMPGREREGLLVLALLSATAACVKLSAAVFTGGVCAVTALAVWRDLGPRARGPLLAALGVGCVGVLPWLARGLVLSGYPLFPSSFGAASFDWSLPESAAPHIRDAVLSWARVPGAPMELVLDGWYWLESWMGRHLRFGLDLSFPLPLSLAAFGLVAAAAAGSTGRSGGASRGLLLLVPGVIALAVWFQMGPDPRFAMFVFWSMAICGLAVALGLWSRAGDRRLGGAWVAGVFVVVVAAAPHDLVGPTATGGFPTPPSAEVEPFRTASGHVVNVAAGPTHQCWDAPLPCAPRRFDPLRLRDPEDLGRGFAWDEGPRVAKGND